MEKHQHYNIGISTEVFYSLSKNMNTCDMLGYCDDIAKEILPQTCAIYAKY